MATNGDRNASIKKLSELIMDVDFAMLTTAESDGTLRSRPMSTQQVEFDGDLWFFTYASTAKVQEMQRDENVNVSYAKPEDQLFISVSGTARLVRDRAKMKELWNPILKAWFPKGLDEPDLALIKVDVEQAEYWDSPNSTMVQLAGFVKSLVTGRPIEGGENEKIDLK